MTAAFIVAIYLLALACFLGLDIFGKTIPPTGYGRAASALGALGAVGMVVGMGTTAVEANAWWARGLGLALAAAAASGAAAALWQRRGPAPKSLAPKSLAPKSLAPKTSTKASSHHE